MNILWELLTAEGATFLVNVVVQSTVILAVTLAAERIVRAHATARHAVLHCGLIAALAAPAIVAMQHRLGVLLVAMPVTFDDACCPEPDGAGEASTAAVVPIKAGPPMRDTERDLALADPNESTDRRLLNPSSSAGARDEAAGSANFAAALRFAITGTFFLWLVGSAMFGLWLLMAWLALVTVRRNARTADYPVVVSALDLVRGAWRGRPPAVLVSTELQTPLLVGLFRPCVLLPDFAVQELSASQLRDVLLHEFAHFRRHDCASVYLQRVAEILFWPNLLLHRLNRLLDEAREDICDNYVLGVTDPADYSRTLLAVTSRAKTGRRPALASCLLSTRRKLEDRIRVLLDERRILMTRLSLWLASPIVVFFAALAVIVGAVRVHAVAQDSCEVSAIREVDAENDGEPRFVDVDADGNLDAIIVEPAGYRFAHDVVAPFGERILIKKLDLRQFSPSGAQMLRVKAWYERSSSAASTASDHTAQDVIKRWLKKDGIKKDSNTGVALLSLVVLPKQQSRGQ